MLEKQAFPAVLAAFEKLFEDRWCVRQKGVAGRTSTVAILAQGTESRLADALAASLFASVARSWEGWLGNGLPAVAGPCGGEPIPFNYKAVTIYVGKQGGWQSS